MQECTHVPRGDIRVVCCNSATFHWNSDGAVVPPVWLVVNCNRAYLVAELRLACTAPGSSAPRKYCPLALLISGIAAYGLL